MYLSALKPKRAENCRIIIFPKFAYVYLSRCHFAHDLISQLKIARLVIQIFATRKIVGPRRLSVEFQGCATSLSFPPRFDPLCVASCRPLLPKSPSRRTGRSSDLRFALRLRSRVPRSRVPASVLRPGHPRSVASWNDRLTVDTSLTMRRAPCHCWEPRERTRLAIVGASRRLSFSLPRPFSPAFCP